MRLTRSLSCSLFLVVSAIWSQDFRASITGLITDPAGAAVAGAKVKAVNQQTNAVTEAVSNETGRYSIPFLIPGKYTVEVEATGFKTLIRDNLELQISVRAAVDFALELGTLSERVTVTAQVSLLETETASRGGIVDNDLLVNVPNAGRNVYQLAFAMPGVYKPSVNQGTEFSLDGLANSRTAINGAASGVGGTESNTDILIDGTSDAKGDRQVIMIPALDSVQEFRVLTNIYDARYGRTGGGIITTTTKSGTNDFHGAIFDRYYDNRLAGNTWSNNRQGVPRPDRTTHNFGFHSTGPIWIPKVIDARNKLFYMVSYDSSPSSSLYTSQFTTPLAEMKTGDFSNLLANDSRPVIIYDPKTTTLGPNGTYVRTPFPGNRIPADRIDPVGAKIVGFYPNPTQAGDGPSRVNNFFLTSNNDGQLWQWTGRLDIRPSSRRAFFGRYGETNMTRCCDQRYPEGNPAEISTIMPRGRRGRTMTLDWTETIGPTTTFNLRAGFSRLENLAWSPQTLAFDPKELGLPASLVGQFARTQYPFVNMGTYMSQGAGPNTQADDTYTIGASAGKVLGAHVMNFGAEAREFRANLQSYGSPSGNFTFSKLWTQLDPNRADAYSGNEIASALLGHPTSGFVDIPIIPAYNARYWAVFFQDDWKLTRRLTLNLGMRWDFESPVTERYNRQTRGFALGDPSPLADAARNRPGIENCPACRNLTGGLLYAGSSGDERYAFAPDRNNFQPRIGTAFLLDDKTVVRGGFGLYTLGQWALGGSTGFSRTTPLIATVDNLTPSITLNNPLPGGLLQPVGSSLGLATDLGLGVNFGYPDRSLPTSKQFSFGIQREFWSGFLIDASYVGNITTGLPVSAAMTFLPASELGRPASYYSERVTNPLAGLLPNNPALNGSTVPRQSLLTAFPQYSSLNVNNLPAGRNRYDAFQLSVKKRFANGLNFQVNYMASKNLEQLTVLNPQDFNLEDILSPVLEKRLSIFDVPQKLSFLGTYEFPVGRGKPYLHSMHSVLNGVLGNWRLGWNWTFQGGFPIDFPNAAPLEARSAKLPSDERTLERWFDTSLFPRVAGPAPFALRNFPTRFPDVRYMGFQNYDFSLSKDILVFTERVRAQIRADFINSFNSPYFTALVATPPNVTSANFGQIRPQQDNSPRTIYLEFRLRF
jgi:hypothetical protein